MAWNQLEPNGPHLVYLVLSLFLISYALFSLFIRNRLHLSEPPLATLVGIIFGPRCLGVLTPDKWALGDDIVQELTRIIVGVQCFVVGVELPKRYFDKHWKSVLVLLGPVMSFGWVISGLFIYLLFNTSIPTAAVIAATLTPTDPVLAASVLANSQFSERVPLRIRHLLSAESGCNDGISFPFLYIGLATLNSSTLAGTLKEWFLITILWQCVFGTFLGLVIGTLFNRLLRFVDSHNFIGSAPYILFYLLLAIFSVGLASTLGVDDFLLAFACGTSFARDGWFASKTAESKFGDIVDLLFNSTMFVYFGSIIPWSSFTSYSLTPGKLIGLLILILLFRRIPIVLACKPLTRHIYTWREALFCGHFGPMGVGALFLAIEARAQLETGTSEPLPSPPTDLPVERQRATEIIWPIVCFVVLGSTMVHGLSTLAISVGSHFSRHEGERAPLIGSERETFGGMVEEEEESDG